MWDRTERALVGRDSRSGRPSAGAIGRLLAIGMVLVAALAACTKAPASSSTRTVTITASGSASGSSRLGLGLRLAEPQPVAAGDADDQVLRDLLFAVDAV